MKLHILKITDMDDSSADAMYYTIKGLREQVLNEWYDIWGEHIDYSKEQIKESDDDLFGYLNSWNFNVEVILTLTENDL
jgi:hypothetical protein